MLAMKVVWNEFVAIFTKRKKREIIKMQEQYKLIIVDSSKIIKIFVFLKYNLKMKLKIKILI